MNGKGSTLAALMLAAAALAGGCEQSGQATAPENAAAGGDSAAPEAPTQAPRTLAAAQRSPASRERTAERQPATPRVTGAPRGIVIEPPSLDLGFVLPGEEPQGKLEIRNTGTEPVRILTVRPTCKCTALNDLDGAVIPPGGSETLTAKLDGRSVTGVRTAAIRILFEGASEPVEVGLRAEVSLPVRISPSIFNLVRGDFSGHVVVESLDGSPFNVLAANGEPPEFIEFNPDLDATRSSYTLKWDLADEAAAGALPTWWVVETDHPECPLAVAWVRHRSTIDLPPRNRHWLVIDKRVLLGNVTPGEPVTATVKVEKLGAAQVHAVRSLSGDFQAELVGVKRLGADAECTIRVTPRPGVEGLLIGEVEFMAGSYTQRIHVIGRAAG